MRAFVYDKRESNLVFAAGNQCNYCSTLFL